MKHIILLLFCCFSLSSHAATNNINWLNWEDQPFALAKQQNKLVLLNLEAVWCHWCHVMDQKTYGNKDVAQLINSHYIAVKVDHDKYPDLANRYRDYGWPATVFLDANGTDLVKRAGYIAPENFLRLMQAVVDDPTPELAARPKFITTYAKHSVLGPPLKEELVQRHLNMFDEELGGLATNQKTLDRDHAEYALSQSTDAKSKQIAEKSIQASFALVDPVWGGIYQYSTLGSWDNPHYEKIMASQAGFLRIYALAYQRFGDAAYLEQANNIVRYLDRFLTAPNGTFYTSQDADLIPGEKATAYFALDDKSRLALGVPRIDKNIYARENGWAIEALAMLFEASRDPAHLQRATSAAEQLLRSHGRSPGGFSHAAKDDEARYLADTLNMGAAFLQLYKVSGERRWLDQAEQAAVFIGTTFLADKAGFNTGLRSSPLKPVRHLDENIKTTRFLNLLSQYTGNQQLARAAKHGMQYLVTPEIALSRIEESGILLAAQEMDQAAPHFTVVGAKTSSSARLLFNVGLDQPGWHKRLEWWDKTLGPLRNPDVTYPSYDKPAGFVCVNKLCSAPSFTSSDYEKMINKISP